MNFINSSSTRAVARWFTKLFALVSLTSGFAGAAHATGPDGVDFEVVPVDLNEKCNSIILKGTKRYRGTAWVMPKVLVSVNRSGKPLFEIIPNSQRKDTYTLRFAVYFPFDNQPIEFRKQAAGANSLFLGGCDLERIRERLNQGKSEADQVQTLSSLPVQKIRVRIDELKQEYLIGSEETEILNYQGTDQIVQFQVERPVVIENILKKLGGEVGLGINFDIFFISRSSNGVIDATFDTSEWADSLEAGFAGRLQAVNEVQVKANISNIVRKQSLGVYIEEGEGPVFESLLKAVMDQIAGLVPPALDAAGAKPSEPGAAPPPVPDAIEGGGKVFKLQAVVQALRAQKQITIHVEGMSRKQQHVYTASTILQGYFSDGNTIEREVSSLAKTPMSVSLSEGSLLSLIPLDYRIEQDRGTYQREYFNREQASRKLTSVFPVVGRRGAELREEPWGSEQSRAYLWEGFWSWKYWVWGIKSWEESWVRVAEGPVDIDQPGPGAPQLRLGFSELGNRSYLLSELDAETDDYVGVLDRRSHRLTVTAKKDLGQLVLSVDGGAGARRSPRPLVSQEYFQETWYAMQSQPAEVLHVPTKDARHGLPEFRATVRVKASTSAAPEDPAAGALEVRSQTISDGVVVVP